MLARLILISYSLQVQKKPLPIKVCLQSSLCELGPQRSSLISFLWSHSCTWNLQVPVFFLFPCVSKWGVLVGIRKPVFLPSHAWSGRKWRGICYDRKVWACLPAPYTFLGGLVPLCGELIIGILDVYNKPTVLRLGSGVENRHAWCNYKLSKSGTGEMRDENTHWDEWSSSSLSDLLFQAVFIFMEHSHSVGNIMLLDESITLRWMGNFTQIWKPLSV